MARIPDVSEGKKVYFGSFQRGFSSWWKEKHWGMVETHGVMANQEALQAGRARGRSNHKFNLKF